MLDVGCGVGCGLWCWMGVVVLDGGCGVRWGLWFWVGVVVLLLKLWCQVWLCVLNVVVKVVLMGVCCQGCVFEGFVVEVVWVMGVVCGLVRFCELLRVMGFCGVLVKVPSRGGKEKSCVICQREFL